MTVILIDPPGKTLRAAGLGGGALGVRATLQRVVRHANSMVRGNDTVVPLLPAHASRLMKTTLVFFCDCTAIQGLPKKKFKV